MVKVRLNGIGCIVIVIDAHVPLCACKCQRTVITVVAVFPVGPVFAIHCPNSLLCYTPTCITATSRAILKLNNLILYSKAFSNHKS